MKGILVVMIFIISSQNIFAQWNGGPSTAGVAYRDGNVVIGNTVVEGSYGTAKVFQMKGDGTWVSMIGSTTSSFSILNASSGTSLYSWGGPFTFWTSPSGIGGQRMIIGPTGNVGIGTATPRGKFDVDGAGDIYLSDDVFAGTTQSLYIPGHIFISPYNGTNVSYLQARRPDNSGSTALQLRTTNAGALVEAMMITSAGNVGIGTISPDAKLAVKGVIHTQEVKVDLQGAMVPDYVFEREYKLLSIAEVEAYIKKNKHLPEVPAAKEMEVNGLNLGEMNLLLLKKVEELTLYVIEQNKTSQQQAEEINLLQNEITHLKRIIKE